MGHGCAVQAARTQLLLAGLGGGPYPTASGRPQAGPRFQLDAVWERPAPLAAP